VQRARIDLSSYGVKKKYSDLVLVELDPNQKAMALYSHTYSG
jgi:hypothetical protein